MKLSSRLTLYFTLIVFISMTFGFVIFYLSIEKAFEQSESREMHQQNKNIAQDLALLPLNAVLEKYPNSRIIKIFNSDNFNLNTSETIYLKDKNLIQAKQIVKIKEQLFEIQTFNYPFVIENEFWWSILLVVCWIYVFVLISIIFLGEMLAKNLYMPFYWLLQQMRKFDVRNEKPIKTLATQTSELDELNQIFTKMATHSIEQYQLLKEFTENLSHELQTPLAHLRGKTELLLNSSLTEEQMQWLSVMNDELHRLSGLNQSLLLLINLEQHKISNEKVLFAQAIKEALLLFEDVFEFSNQTLETQLNEEIYISINPSLLQILLSNLLSNANRYTPEFGKIYIELTLKHFIIRNSGNQQIFTNETIFKRFVKGSSEKSLGIGLALVKKIAHLYHLPIKYQFIDNFHEFKICLTTANELVK